MAIGSEASDPVGWMPQGPAARLATGLSLAVAGGLIVLVGVRWYAYQWDFHMFYGSAQDFSAGRSPYRGSGLSFYHPPLMLYVYRLFTLVPLPVALTVWYVLKLSALATLLWIWNSDFVRLRWNAPTVLFFILAYGAAIYADLVSGNVSIFEELLLWLGFSYLVRGRYLIFCVCVVLASQVKLTPIFFAVLLLAACERPQWRWLFATLVGFVGVFLLNAWLQPALWLDFWAVSTRLDERGDDTSLMALVRDVFDRLLGSSFAPNSRVDELVFVAAASGVGIASLWMWFRYRQRSESLNQRLVICFSCCVFALISPRFKVYTHIILLAPTLYLLGAVEWRQKVSLVAALIVVLVTFPMFETLLPIRFMFELFNHYMPLMASIVVWSGYILVLRELAADPSSPGTLLVHNRPLLADPRGPFQNLGQRAE